MPRRFLRALRGGGGGGTLLPARRGQASPGSMNNNGRKDLELVITCSAFPYFPIFPSLDGYSKKSSVGYFFLFFIKLFKIYNFAMKDIFRNYFWYEIYEQSFFNDIDFLPENDESV